MILNCCNGDLGTSLGFDVSNFQACISDVWVLFTFEGLKLLVGLELLVKFLHILVLLLNCKTSIGFMFHVFVNFASFFLTISSSTSM
ncbi:hypothetical protein RIF29_17714 [Crotalaria pallida]|uniref:Uncharacterized protein n=1 Tax=Crotalaria pallida TaxID=3830 RepID=A0AAN9FL00_CROPI